MAGRRKEREEHRMQSGFPEACRGFPVLHPVKKHLDETFDSILALLTHIRGSSGL